MTDRLEETGQKFGKMTDLLVEVGQYFEKLPDYYYFFG
jgi:hypothetical protein